MPPRRTGNANSARALASSADGVNTGHGCCEASRSGSRHAVPSRAASSVGPWPRVNCRFSNQAARSSLNSSNSAAGPPPGARETARPSTPSTAAHRPAHHTGNPRSSLAASTWISTAISKPDTTPP
ncbi:hypothetical protein [Streptacidiphilus sp. PAMC 29251]